MIRRLDLHENILITKPLEFLVIILKGCFTSSAETVNIKDEMNIKFKRLAK